MSDYWTGLLNHKPEMKQEIKTVLMMQSIAATRRVTEGKRLRALIQDVADIYNGEFDNADFESKKIAAATRLPDRC